jgi:phosphoribosylanthranilate isomerase
MPSCVIAFCVIAFCVIAFLRWLEAPATIIVTCMNHPFKIKICGVTSAQDAQMVAGSNADAIGLNFYPSSKRFVDLPAAQSIIAGLAQTHPKLVTVGVFVNADAEQILDTCTAIGLDAVQLHGDESPDFLKQLIQAAETRGLMLDYIRAIRTLPSNQQAAMDLEEIESEINRWVEAGAGAILIDAAVAGDFGGTGKQVDWAGFAKLNSSVPKILAGGLTPENLESAIVTAEPTAVDVASGVETNPRQKNAAKTLSFASTADKFLSRTN